MLPVTGKDVVAGFMLRHLMFYGFDGVVREVMGDERQRAVSDVVRQITPQDLQLPAEEPLLEPQVLKQPPLR